MSKNVDVGNEREVACKCGNILNIPDEIPQPPSPPELNDKLILSMVNITCPNCGASYIYDKGSNSLISD